MSQVLLGVSVRILQFYTSALVRMTVLTTVVDVRNAVHGKCGPHPEDKRLIAAILMRQEDEMHEASTGAATKKKPSKTRGAIYEALRRCRIGISDDQNQNDTDLHAAKQTIDLYMPKFETQNISVADVPIPDWVLPPEAVPRPERSKRKRSRIDPKQAAYDAVVICRDKITIAMQSSQCPTTFPALLPALNAVINDHSDMAILANSAVAAAERAVESNLHVLSRLE